MSKTNNKSLTKIIVATFAIFVTVFAISSASVNAVQSTVNLGTAAPFAILAGTPNITDAGNASVIHGNVGLSPATGAGIGLLCSQVTGTIYSVNAAGPLPCRITDGPLMVIAKNNLTTAYTDASGRTPVTIVPNELGGTTLTSGVYASDSTILQISAPNPLILDGQGNPNAVFIFEVAAEAPGLTVGPGSVVQLTGQAQACNVFWRVDSAAIDTTANFKGTILALNSITVANGATIEGRLLAQDGNVTLINDTITVPVCVTPSSETTNNVIPGLPNTGSQSDASLVWVIVPSFIVLGILSLAYVAHKKHLI